MQSLNLHDQMTILENFFFYGYLFGMNTESIQARAIDLITFLDLPSGHRFVKTLRWMGAIIDKAIATLYSYSLPYISSFQQ